MSAQDPRLRFRVYVNAELVDETWVNTRSPERLHTIEEVWARHQQIIQRAQTDCQRWLIEIHDPARPEDPALRFGSDETGVDQPALNLGALLQKIATRTTGGDEHRADR
jgi:hypothetical protein